MNGVKCDDPPKIRGRSSMAEQGAFNSEVVGSSPTGPTALRDEQGREVYYDEELDALILIHP
jgi:hypothetical protein